MKASAKKLQAILWLCQTFLCWSVFFLFIFAHHGLAQDYQKNMSHTEVTLIPQYQQYRPGEEFWVAVRMKMDPHWHVYWQNPGDSGMPPKFDWQLPDGFVMGPHYWPYPHRLDEPPLATYVYENEVLFLSRLQTPAQNLAIGTLVPISVKASWLVCKTECLPGQLDLNFSLEVAEEHTLNPPWLNIDLDQVSTQWPQQSALWNWQATLNQNHWSIVGQALSEYVDLPKQIQFFPYRDDMIEHAAEQLVHVDDRRITIEIPASNLMVERPESLDGIVFADTAWEPRTEKKALEIHAPVSEQSLMLNPSAQNGSTSMWLIMVMAFLGGLILNVMPCVLPVLSIKALKLMEHAHQERSVVMKQGLAFLFGIIFTFWLLFFAMLLLKWSGRMVGWGFQFQSPHFLLAMILLLHSFALNLLGVFEMGVSLTRFGQRISPDTGSLPGMFLNGVLTVIVATPCTAPFMGSALAYAFLQPWPIGLMVFTMLAIGLGMPYVMLSLSPATRRWLPKPGPWMSSLKKTMAFPMLAVVIWLLWIWGQQFGNTAMAKILFILLLVSYAFWIYGRGAGLTQSSRKTWVGRVTLLVVITLGFVWPLQTLPDDESDAKLADKNVAVSEAIWISFSPERLAEGLQNNRWVLIDFTAAWCLTCQVNKKTVLEKSVIIERLKELNVLALKADWTHYDPMITEALARYGKNSIPFYVVYKPGQKEPEFLPEILTIQRVLNSLEPMNE